MTVLVTGGAGYIGSHVVRALESDGHQVVVVDDLSSGIPEFAPGGIVASVLDTNQLTKIMRERRVESVIHLAGFKYAATSIERPEHCLLQNVAGLLSVAAAAAANDVRALVFSSSAAIYGSPPQPATELTDPAPQNPYGWSKLLAEQALNVCKVRSLSLRYFNVAGSGWPDLFDTSPHNLFPRICDDLTAERAPHLFGVNHPTPDGTAIRDYVHVSDVATAHVAALDALLSGEIPPRRVFNLGSGFGYSVREVLNTFADVTGLPVVPEIHPARPGDPARIVADVSRAKAELGWTPKLGLHDMVASAWEAHQWSAALA